AEEQDAQHHQRGGDRAVDERGGDAHRAVLPAAPPPPAVAPLPLPPCAAPPLEGPAGPASAARITPLAPGARRSWPSATTVSPAATPSATTERSRQTRCTVTGRISTVVSALTT